MFAVCLFDIRSLAVDPNAFAMYVSKCVCVCVRERATMLTTPMSGTAFECSVFVVNTWLYLYMKHMLPLHLAGSPFCSGQTPARDRQCNHCCCLYLLPMQRAHALQCCQISAGDKWAKRHRGETGKLRVLSLDSTFLSFVSEHVSYRSFLCTNYQGKEEETWQTKRQKAE